MAVTPIGGLGGNIAIEGPQAAASVPATDVSEPVPPPFPGVADISGAGRVLASEWVGAERAVSRAEEAKALLAENTESVRELMQTLRDYDNSVAVQRYVNNLRASAAYGTLSAPQPAAAPAAPAAMPAETRAALSAQVDAWLAGEAVFQPAMLGVPTTDGFMFSPLTSEAQEAASYADILASGNREVLIGYLSRLAQLTPLNFIFYDPTGLGPLSLVERREFLANVAEILASAEIQVDPAELTYAVNPDLNFDIKMSWEVAEGVREKVEEALNHDNTPAAAGRLEKLRAFARRLAATA